MGPFGVQEMMVIFILALLLFGPKKLPELAKILGKGLSEFRRAKNELKSTFDTHMQELEREARVEEQKKNPVTSAAAIKPYTPYAYEADEYGKRPSDYGSSGAETSWPAEPPVESHALPPAPVVTGTVPRAPSTGTDEQPV